MQAALGLGKSLVESVHSMCIPNSPSGVGTYVTAGGSLNVLINGSPSYRVTDIPVPHPNLALLCATEAAPLILGSPNVFVNGLAMGRVGDAHGCGGLIQTGSTNVLVN